MICGCTKQTRSRAEQVARVLSGSGRRSAEFDELQVPLAGHPQDKVVSEAPGNGVLLRSRGQAARVREALQNAVGKLLAAGILGENDMHGLHPGVLAC